MKKVTTIILLAVLTICIASALLGCNTTITDDIKLVDGYYVYKIPGNASKPEDRYALFGAQDEKIINGVLTVPEIIGGLRVTGIGYYDGAWAEYGTPVPMYANDKIRKIVINHSLTIYGGSLSKLKNLVELDVYKPAYRSVSGKDFGCQLYAVKFAEPQINFWLTWDMFEELRVIKSPYFTSMLNQQNIVAYIGIEASSIKSDFSGYTSLTTFIIPETVTEIDKDSFANSKIDVFVRHTKENCPEGLKNGWDEGVNVVWGFEDEIVVFDTFEGSAIQCGGTNKNYQIAKTGDKLEEPQQPTKEGYTFTGWYKDYALSEQWNFETDTVEESTVLVAGWQRK